MSSDIAQVRLGSRAVSWNAVGQPGETNYQLAQQNGFTGTLAQWLPPLLGPTARRVLQVPGGRQGRRGRPVRRRTSWRRRTASRGRSHSGSRPSSARKVRPVHRGQPAHEATPVPRAPLDRRARKVTPASSDRKGRPARRARRARRAGLAEVWGFLGSGRSAASRACRGTSFDETVAASNSMLPAGSYVSPRALT